MTTATAAGHVGCRRCGAVAEAGAPRCGLCGARLRPVDPASLQTVWALLVVGMVAYVPANIWPMLVIRRFGATEESTILGGLVDLAAHGSYAIAAVVGLASVVVPVGKFLIVGWLAAAVGRGGAGDAHARHRLHRAVEMIGRWSMVDVFVVAILAALVQLGFLAAIRPGVAALFFALSVIFTMLAAQAFDPRLLWIDQAEEGFET